MLRLLNEPMTLDKRSPKWPSKKERAIFRGKLPDIRCEAGMSVKHSIAATDLSHDRRLIDVRVMSSLAPKGAGRHRVDAKPA